MTLRVNTNILAINAQRTLNIHHNDLSKVFEHLSSGLRINRAADDSAGLAISEKMRSQIRGLNQAMANSQDDINLIQTAEGALNESQTILHRMRELAIQSANDTLVNSDREKVQQEIEQLRLELTEIAKRTQFNGRNLLDGSVASSTIGSNASLDISQNIRVGDVQLTIPDLKDFILGSSLIVSAGSTRTLATTDVAYQFKIVPWQQSAASDPISTAIEVRSSLDGLLTVIQLGIGLDPTIISLTVGVGLNLVTVAAVSVDYSNLISLCDINKTAMVQVIARKEPVTLDSSLTMHVGPNEGQLLKFGIDDMSARALRLETLSLVGTTDEDSRLKAQNAIGVLDSALERISSLRAKLGAYQNRLESKIKTLSITSENTSNSESAIRDVDVAKETAALTRAQILVQAGTAILAQANATPQAALELLK